MKIHENREARSSLLPLYLKKPGVGRIHSIFRTGLNIQFEDILVYISSKGTPLSAFGMNIDEEKLKQILNSARVNDIVANKGDRLIFYSIYKIIIIDYENIEQIDLKLPKIKCSISQIPYTKLYSYLASIDFAQCIGIDLDEITYKYVDELLNSNKSDLYMNSAIVRFFSGRGKGLTPSGDDILIGFTLAILRFGKFENWIKALESEIYRNTTTMISVAYLRALLEGYASEYFILLVKLIDEEDVAVIEGTIKKVQSFGHTSGNDTLFGFFLGLRFLAKI